MKINHDILRKTGLVKFARWWWNHRSVLKYARNRFQWHVYPRIHFVPAYPLHIDIELSSRCQLKCPMCFRQHRPIEKQGHISLNLFKKIIDEIAGKVYSIKFTGRGEPLLHPQIQECLAYLKGKPFGEIAMITNGLIMDRTIQECVIDNELDFISFSIDGLSTQYEHIRNPGKYEQIHNIVSSLHQLRESNQRHRPMIRIQSVKLPPTDEKRYLDTWNTISDDILFLYFKDFAADAPNIQEERYVCPLLYQRMMIHFDGTIPMCINDEYEESIMGNINNNTIKTIWHGRQFSRARSAHVAGERTSDYVNCNRCALTREGHGEHE